MKRFLADIPAISVAAGLAACTPAPEAGIADPDQFRLTATRQVVTSNRPAEAVAACFESRAALLPASVFFDDAETGGKTYRLRAFGRTYEEILFVPAARGGSTATVLTAPNLQPAWTKGFAQDRGATLAACASGAKE